MKVEHQIVIDASPARVWEVTTDVENWPVWTPSVTSVSRVDSGPFQVGSVARIRQPAQPEAEWVVTAFEPGRRFAWETRRSGLHMVGSHQIVAEGDGTRNILRLEASGYLALLFWPVLRLAIGRALADENRGLKRYCEATSRP